MTPTMTARYLDVARELLDRVAEQDAELDRAADVCADAIGEGGLVHLFGTGHSRIASRRCSRATARIPAFIRSSSCR